MELLHDIVEVRDQMIEDLLKLTPGSDEVLKQAQAIKVISDINRDDRKFEFEVDKEETRKLEKSNELEYSVIDAELKKIDLAIRFIDVVLNPGSRLLGIFMNNRVRVKRDVMGYQFEESGVIGSHTFNNAQKDKYD